MLLRSLILAGSAQGIFLILLLKAGKKTFSSHVLKAWLIALSFQLIFYYDNLSGAPVAPDWLSLICFALPLLSSPLLYLYICSLSLQLKRIWLHFLLFVIYCIVLFFMPVRKVIDGFPHFAASASPLAVDTIFYLQALVPAAYVLLSLVALWRLQKSLALSFAFLFIALFALIRFGATFELINQQEIFAVVGVSLAFYVFFIGYYALKIPTRPQYQNSGLADGTAKEIYSRLTLHMQSQQPFLNEGLTLDLLAAQLNVLPHHLSQAINQLSGTNFFSFVNTFRVEAVKTRLKDRSYAHYSILGIAYDCGFRSKSSFNKIFKDITGETPSAYQNKSLSLPVRTTKIVG